MMMIIIIITDYIKSITNYSSPISVTGHNHLPKSQYLLLTMKGSIVSSHHLPFLKSSFSNTPG